MLIKMNKGQTIIEVLVALSIAVIIASAMTVVVLSSLNNAQYGRDQNLATKYAQDGMEIVRRVRDTNPLVFQNTFPRQDPGEGDPSTQTFCIGNDDSNAATFSAETGEMNDHHESSDNRASLHCLAPNVGNPVKFIREVTLQKDAIECIAATGSPADSNKGLTKATVIIKWADSKCSVSDTYCHNVQVVSCLNNVQ